MRVNSTRRRSRNALIMGVVGFVVLQTGLGLATETWWPKFRDPEYGRRLGILQSRLAPASQTSFSIIMLGSSRTVRGFRPDVVETGLERTLHRPVVAFNFGLTGAGPLLELLTLRRLVEKGIRPDLLLIEVLPALYQESHPEMAAMGISLDRMWHQDIPFVVRYGAGSRESREKWWQALLLPGYTSRFAILCQIAPWLVPYERRLDWVFYLDQGGWIDVACWSASTAERRRALDHARTEYKETLSRLHPGGLSCQILRDLLDFCRSEHIPAALVVMPEGPIFRSWYCPSAWPEFHAFLSELERDFGTPVVNAREWIDEDGFIDSHHLLPEGAFALSSRLAAETIPALIQNHSLPNTQVARDTVPSPAP